MNWRNYNGVVSRRCFLGVRLWLGCGHNRRRETRPEVITASPPCQFMMNKLKTGVRSKIP